MSRRAGAETRDQAFDLNILQTSDPAAHLTAVVAALEASGGLVQASADPGK